MAPEIRLAPARLADAAPIARMSRRLIEQGLAWRWTPRAVAARIPDSETAAVVAWTGRRMVGFAIMNFHFSRREAHLLLMAVDPALRRSGVGKALWGWLETLARRGGVERVQLEVRAENLGANAFYRSLGFREVARLPGYYQPQEQPHEQPHEQAREDALRMVAELRRRRASAAGSGTGVPSCALWARASPALVLARDAARRAAGPRDGTRRAPCD